MELTPAFDLSRTDLERLFLLKYGSPSETGWAPRVRWEAGHFNPDDRYEALVERIVHRGCRWLDVGCGRSLFPSNDKLAKVLSDRCSVLVGVDPDPTLFENPYVHRRVPSRFEDFESDKPFDVVTLRMVVEHVQNPSRLASALARCTASGGLVIIYTVNRFSPIPLLTALVPFRLHHPVKVILWGTERKDTFPTEFRMNTRRSLKTILEKAGFRELHFAYLDDCRTTGRVKWLQRIELGMWRVTSRLGVRYPENCLLGVYRKNPD